MTKDHRPEELQFDWVKLNSHQPWHITDEGKPNVVWCNSATGLVTAKTAGIINNPVSWGPKNRICDTCMRIAWARVYDYTLSKPKQ
jgi:hypothetical protein